MITNWITEHWEVIVGVVGGAWGFYQYQSKNISDTKQKKTTSYFKLAEIANDLLTDLKSLSFQWGQVEIVISDDDYQARRTELENKSEILAKEQLSLKTLIEYNKSALTAYKSRTTPNIEQGNSILTISIDLNKQTKIVQNLSDEVYKLLDEVRKTPEQIRETNLQVWQNCFNILTSITDTESKTTAIIELSIYGSKTLLSNLDNFFAYTYDFEGLKHKENIDYKLVFETKNLIEKIQSQIRKELN